MCTETRNHPQDRRNVSPLRFGKSRRRSRRSRLWLPPLLTLGMSTTAMAASIEGSVVSASQEPLAKVPVCLRIAGEDRLCDKIQSTDRNGTYRFNGLKEDLEYSIAVYQDDTAAGRKFERYRTYVWSPLVQDVAIYARNESISLAPFEGKFNFSNFQRNLTLTGVDFPELASLDLAGDYVMLKVFMPPTSPDTPPETIFLGRVMNAGTLSVAASVPLSATWINYQIYSASLSIDGSITLTGGQ